MISGTSHDEIDAAVVNFEPVDGTPSALRLTGPGR
jgi:hypothetical protein